MLEDLKEAVLAANLQLPAEGLVTLTWGNVSGRDPASGLVVIKPSGLPYTAMTSADMVVVDQEGNVVEGGRRPSTDTPTHLVLYQGLEGIGGVVHTHSTWATSWAQAHRPVPVLGTTHADLCPGEVPLTAAMTPEEVAGGYERAHRGPGAGRRSRQGRSRGAGRAREGSRPVLLGDKPGRGG